MTENKDKQKNPASDKGLEEKTAFRNLVDAEWENIKKVPIIGAVSLPETKAPNMAAIKEYVSNEYPYAAITRMERTAGRVDLVLEDYGEQFMPHLLIGNKYSAIVIPDKFGNIEKYQVYENGTAWGGLKVIKDFAEKKKYIIKELLDVNILEKLRQQEQHKRRRCKQCGKILHKSIAEYKANPFCNDTCKEEYKKFEEQFTASLKKYDEYFDYPDRRRCKWCGAILQETNGKGRPLDFCPDTDHYQRFKDLGKKIKTVRAAIPPPSDTDGMETEKYTLRDFKENPGAALHSGCYHDDIDELWLLYLYLKNDVIIDKTYGIHIYDKLRQIPIRYCRECGEKITIDKNSQSDFCSEICRHRYWNKIYSEKNKDKKD